MRVLRFAPEFECHPVWEIRADELINMAPETLPISQSLAADINAWAKLFQENYRDDDPAQSGFVDPFRERQHVADGLKLAERLLDELGREWVLHVNF